MYVAKNLKRLRHERGWTQEELAAHVGVSGQAVSKWERGESYPDITLLPGLAHCFHVTVDELLGMAEIRDEEEGAYARANTLQKEGKYGDAVAVYEEALQTFPAALGLWAARAETLAMAGEEIDHAIETCERFLEEEMSEKRRSSAVAALCFLYQSAAMAEKAETLARSRPHARESRELLLPNFLDQPQREAYLRAHLPGILTDICRLIDGGTDTLEEKLRQISLGISKDLIAPAEAMKKITAFLSESEGS